MKILACDDDTLFLDMISEYCQRFQKESSIPIALVSYSHGCDVLAYYKNHKDIDLFILDIKMSEIDGMQIAKEIRRTDLHTRIVFLTSAPEYAPQGYVFGISRYWIKPLSYDIFAKDVKALYKEIVKENTAYIFETIGTAAMKVYLDEILYIETLNRKTCVHKADSSYLSTTKLSAYEKKLDHRFFRCHASYIVNMDYIVKIQGPEITLGNGEIIYISKGRKKGFFAELTTYFGRGIF